MPSKTSSKTAPAGGVIDAVAARQDDKERQAGRVAALRDRVCAVKPGAAHEYRLSLFARCTPVAGRALEVAQQKKRERAAAAAAKAKSGSAKGSTKAKSGSANAAPSAKAGGVPVAQTKAEIEYLKKRLKAMGPGDGAMDVQDVRMCILIARSMSLTRRRRDHPNVMERFEHLTETKNLSGAEAHLREIFQILEQLLEMELRAAS